MRFSSSVKLRAPVAPLGWEEMRGVLIGCRDDTVILAVLFRGLQNCGVSVSYNGGVRVGEWLPHSLSLLEHDGGVGGMLNPVSEVEMLVEEVEVETEVDGSLSVREFSPRREAEE